MITRNFWFFGKNEHEVEIPGFFSFMGDKLIGPFYILQYIFCVSFILTDYVLFGVALLVLILLVTIINYILLYKSYQSIKEMA